MAARSRRIEPRHVRHCDVPLRRCKHDSNRRRIWGCLGSSETNTLGQAWQRRNSLVFMLSSLFPRANKAGKQKKLFSCFLAVFLQRNTEALQGNQTRGSPTSAMSTPAAPASDSEDALPSGWSSTVCSATGKPYYWNLSDPNNTVTWERPK